MKKGKQPKLEAKRILEVLQKKARRALHPSEICSRLGIPSARKQEVTDLLERLSQRGEIVEAPGGRFQYRNPADQQEQRRRSSRTQPLDGNEGSSGKNKRSGALRGRLALTPRGFGFVVADDGGPDVFIPAGRLGAALHGDLVEIRARRSAKGRDGEVTRVVERGLTRVGGILRGTGRFSWLEPEDARMRGPMRVMPPIPKDAKEGMSVAAEIIEYPKTSSDVPHVKILKSLGVPGTARVEVNYIKLREGVVEDFPDDVLEQARTFPPVVPERDKQSREDLRSLGLVTIDPEDARDHDDAVWAERRDDGTYRVIIAIADVSHYVREGTPIDREAITRGCSIYLPDRAIPMLPAELSSNLASLVPNEDRLALAVEVELSATGAIRKYRYIEGVMCSQARLTYGGVARALRLTELADPQHAAEERRELLAVLMDVSRLLRGRRLKRGALDFDLPEARVVLNAETEEPVNVIRSRKDPGVRQAYNLVEELMLLANEVVAEDLSHRELPTIYRVHGNPDERKIEAFAELAASVGYILDPEAATKPRLLAEFLRRIDGTVHAQALGFLLLRAMQQATYQTTNVGHFGLAAKNYLHFTSPIRRYPDLVVHRLVRAAIHGHSPDHAELDRKLKWQAAEASRLERRAMTVEREAVDLYRALLMQNRLGETFDATITSVVGHGFYCAFDEPFVEALCAVETLGDDFYELDDYGIRLVGRKSGATYALGDRVTVRLEDVSIQRRTLRAIPIEHLPDDKGLISSARPHRGKPRDGQKSRNTTRTTSRSNPRHSSKSRRRR